MDDVHEASEQLHRLQQEVEVGEDQLGVPRGLLVKDRNKFSPVDGCFIAYSDPLTHTHTDR